MIVTCHTPGCPNEGAAITLQFDPLDDGTPVVPDAYVCGVCGERITDVVPVTPYAADGPQDAPDA